MPRSADQSPPPTLPRDRVRPDHASLTARLARAEAALERTEAELRESRDRLEAALSHAAVGVAQFDRDGRFIFLNDRLAEILGQEREALLGTPVLGMTHPEDLPRCAALLATMRATGAPFSVEKRMLRPDGAVVWVHNHVSLASSGSGCPGIATALVQEVTERREAETRRESLARELEAERMLLATILRHLPMGVGIAGPDGRIALGNDALGRFLGEVVPSTRPDAAAHWIAHHPDGRRIEPRDFPAARALRGETVVPGQEFLRRFADGRSCWTRVSAVPVPGSAGEVAAAVVLVEDIGEHKRAETQRELLLAELNHRVKNILTTVQSMTWQTLKGSGGDPERFARHFGDRLRSLARAHDLLTHGGWGAMPVEPVLRAALEPWLEALGPERLRIAASGCGATLSPRQAQALVLALHELATNAAKYGALSVPGGEVHLRCDAVGEAGELRLGWAESGGPPLSGPPTRRGFGTRLLERGLAQDLGPGGAVELDFAPSGLRAWIHLLPAPPDLVPAPSPGAMAQPA